MLPSHWLPTQVSRHLWSERRQPTSASFSPRTDHMSSVDGRSAHPITDNTHARTHSGSFMTPRCWTPSEWWGWGEGGRNANKSNRSATVLIFSTVSVFNWPRLSNVFTAVTEHRCVCRSIFESILHGNNYCRARNNT